MDDLQKIQTSEIRYRRLFEAAQDGILILDAATGAITDVNPFLIDMLGYTREEFMGKKLWEVGAFKDIEASREAFEALQRNKYIRYENLPLRAEDGHLVQVEFVSNVYLAGDEKVIQCNIRDITERKQAQDTQLKNETLLLREQSARDYLTGLFNRRYLEETLERELDRATRNHGPLGIIMLDVDDFKGFNDIHGHAAGDVVLSKLGELLLGHFRLEDIPCRYGGDEFIVALPDASLEATRERAERLCEHARHLHSQFEGQLLEITLSIGVASFPNDGVTSVALLKAVDTALYRAKREGRNRVAVSNQ